MKKLLTILFLAVFCSSMAVAAEEAKPFDKILALAAKVVETEDIKEIRVLMAELQKEVDAYVNSLASAVEVNSFPTASKLEINSLAPRIIPRLTRDGEGKLGDLGSISNSLVIGRWTEDEAHASKVKNSILILKGPVKITRLSNSILISLSQANISYMNDGLAIVKRAVHVSHLNNTGGKAVVAGKAETVSTKSILVSGNILDISHGHDAIVTAPGRLEISHAYGIRVLNAANFTDIGHRTNVAEYSREDPSSRIAVKSRSYFAASKASLAKLATLSALFR